MAKRNEPQPADAAAARALEKRRRRRRRDILIAAGVFLAAAVAVTLIVRFSMKVDTVTLAEPLYKYQVDVRLDYTGPTVLSYGDDGVTTLQNGGKTLQMDAEPLYFADADAVFLPRDMILALPDRPLLARAQHFSTFRSTDSGVELSRGSGRTMVSRGFLYDGRDRYLFLGAVYLTWGDEQVKLSPLSYVIVQADSTLLYLDHAAGDCRLLETGMETVRAVSDQGYALNLTNDVLTLPDGREVLLFSDPAALDVLMPDGK